MKPVHRQRAILCDLIESLTQEQWDAETLCDGWDTGDMVAHLLVRERQPWNAVGVVVPPLESLHTSAMERKKSDGREAITRALRDGPPWLFSQGPLARVQVGEDYIHSEDIRRGGAADPATSDLSSTGTAGLDPDDGTGDPEIAACLWEAVSRFSTMTLGGLPAEGIVTLTDGARSRSFTVGGRFARTSKTIPPGAEQFTVTGPVGDLLLYVTGRSAVEVTTEGSETIGAALAAGGRGV